MSAANDPARMLVKSLSSYIVNALIGEPSEVAVFACIDAAVKLLGHQNPEMSTQEAIDAIVAILTRGNTAPEAPPEDPKVEP